MTRENTWPSEESLRKSIKGKLPPLVGEYYKLGDDIFKVTLVNRGKDEIRVKSITTGQGFVVRFVVFHHGYRRVWKTGSAARLVGRTARSLYEYEREGKIQKAKRYTTLHGESLRFYTKEDILEMRDMIADIHGGRPRDDGKSINNTIPSKAELLKTFRERYGE